MLVKLCILGMFTSWNAYILEAFLYVYNCVIFHNGNTYELLWILYIIFLKLGMVDFFGYIHWQLQHQESQRLLHYGKMDAKAVLVKG
jgi:hypothetical protein